MKFKDGEYKDLTGKKYDGSIYLPQVGLTSLEGAPNEVTGNLMIQDNEGLTSLKYAPSRIGKSFSANECGLTSLEGGPTIMIHRDNPDDRSSYYVHGNPNLKSLKGAPDEVHNFYIHSCDIQSLEFCPNVITGQFHLYGNKNIDLSNGPTDLEDEVYLWENSSDSHEYSLEELFNFEARADLGVGMYKYIDNHLREKEMFRVLELIRKLRPNDEITWEKFRIIHKLGGGEL